jgi:DNA polymerase-1
MEKLLVFDTNSIIHRAFHALPPLTSKGGEPSGAVYGSLLAFFRMMDEIKPSYVVAVFDSPQKTFRHKKYKEYKANRAKSPEELISQIIKTKEVFSDMGVAVLAKAGLEADDIVGAISCLAPKNIETIIVSGDSDILQLVSKKTKVYNLKRGIKENILYDEKMVKERYGVVPEKIADIKALQGDVSDNIPGVSGIGEKTATSLIIEFGSIENLYKELEKENADSISERIKEKLKKGKKKALLSKELALIKRDCFQEFDYSKFYFQKEDEKIIKILEELGFPSIAYRFLGIKNISKKPAEREENNLTFNF